MGVASYATTVKKSGTSTAFTTEACTLVTGKIYQITDVAKRVWDKAGTFIIYDNAIDETANVEWINYLFGTFKFLDSYSVNTPVTVTGDYFPMAAIAGSNAYSLEMSGDILDDTEFGDTYRTRIYGIRDVMVSLTRWDQLDDALRDIWENKEIVVIEIRPGGSGDYAKGFFVAESDGKSGDIGGLESEEISFQLAGEVDAYRSFGWGT